MYSQKLKIKNNQKSIIIIILMYSQKLKIKNNKK